MAEYTRQPRVVISKKDCVCAETNKKIGKGQRCWFNPDGGKVYHLQSEKAKQFVQELSINPNID
jgi:hypothetical protein